VTHTYIFCVLLLICNLMQLTDCGIVKAAMAYIPCKDTAIGYNALKLLYNLSFSPLVRQQVAELDAVKNVASFLADGRTRMMAVKVLYNLSADSVCFPAFANSDCLTSVIKLCLMSNSSQVRIDAIPFQFVRWVWLGAVCDFVVFVVADSATIRIALRQPSA